MIDPTRFRRLAAAQWAEQWRAWAWFLAIGVGVHACVWLLVTSGGTAPSHWVRGAQTAIYMIGLVATGALFAGRWFEALSRPGPALLLLMRPASTTEKWLLALIGVGIAYPLAYTIAFQVCNLPAVLLAQALRPVSDGIDRGHYAWWLPFLRSDDRAADAYLMTAVFALQGFMLCAVLFFRRLVLLKAFVSAFVLLLLVTLVVGVTDADVDVFFSAHQADSDLETAMRGWLVLVWAGVPLLLWLAAWRLLRERELR